jgi:nucleotide-binding universal stress UspA family protein
MKASLTQLLVHLDASPEVAQRLQAARRIAAGHGAAVTALYAVTSSLMNAPFAFAGAPEVAASLQEFDDECRNRAHAAFGQSMASPGIHPTWAQADGYPIVAAFAQQALYADLLVLGQHNPTDTASAGVPFDFVETVLATSGKPALILPYTGAPEIIGENVVIAWKPTREAARAVGAAVPMLQRALNVHVLSWGGEDEAISGNRLDLDGYLKLRGIEPVWHRESDSEPEFLGESLLSRAFDLNADLLVMGCYGHSRAREWVLGGTTRTVLSSMTLPVLMAH